MVVTAKGCRRERIEIRILDDEFTRLIASPVVPDDSMSVAHEPATRGIANASRTKEIDAKTAQVEVGMIVHAIASLSPERESIVAIGPDVTIDDNGTRSTSEDGHLMRRIAWLHSRTVVIVDSETTDNAIIGPFLKYDDPIAYFTTMIFGDFARCTRLGKNEDSTVTILAHQQDVRTVDDDLLMVSAFANQDLIRLNRVLWRAFDGQLNAITGVDDGIKQFWTDIRFPEPIDRTVFISTRGIQAHGHLIGRIETLSPLMIEREKAGGVSGIPGITVATFAAYLFQVSTGNTVTVADIRLATLKVIETGP